MTIGERIRERRKELGLTQTELANRLGNKSKVSVSTVENDKEDLTTDRIAKYAKALETTPTYLMGLDEEFLEKQRIFVMEETNTEEQRKYEWQKRMLEYLRLFYQSKYFEDLLREAKKSKEENLKLTVEFMKMLNNRDKDRKED